MSVPDSSRVGAFNSYGVWAIYRFEMARALRTLWQSLVTPVITTSLYFVVFGSAIGSRMTEVGGVSYGAFIVPGLIMLSLFTQSIFNASFGIYFPKFTGTIYEIFSAPVSAWEIVLAYVGAAATKSIALGLIILATAALFVPIEIQHPVWMAAFLILTATTFSLFGFIIGIWANGFDRHAAASVADDHPLQPGRLSDQRLSLELLWPVGRRHRRQPGDDDGLLPHLPGRGGLDLPHRLSAQELTS
jgi:ABC-2 type transport system permease protein